MLNQNQVTLIKNILQQTLFNNGVSCVVLIDMAGNVVVSLDDGRGQSDIYSLACLAAGNYGAVKAMANLIKEEDFSLLFHKGKKVNIHFKTIMSEYLLINIFNKDISLGFLRLKVTEAKKKIYQILHIEEEDPYMIANLPQIGGGPQKLDNVLSSESA
jgi:predicted regulator of Ras-like GTPase activity (Roadblock/LC7/MglB family)